MSASPVESGLNRLPGIVLALWILPVVGLAACDSLAPEPPLLTPTWSYSAPTLEPSPYVILGPPSERAPDSDYIGPGQTNPTAAALPWDSDLPPVVVDSGGDVNTVQVALRDNTILLGDLHEHPPVQTEQGSLVQRLPGVLFLGATQEEWGIFPAQLRDAGFTVLVMDMQDRLASADFTDVIQAFSEVGSVHPGLIGVIGISEGADQALIGCALQYLCDAVVLLSPLGRDTLVNVMAQYNPRPLLVAANRDDPVSFAAAQALQLVATGPIAGHFSEHSGNGVNVLTDRDLAQSIIQWMEQYLAE